MTLMPKVSISNRMFFLLFYETRLLCQFKNFHNQLWGINVISFKLFTSLILFTKDSTQKCKWILAILILITLGWFILNFVFNADCWCGDSLIMDFARLHWTFNFFKLYLLLIFLKRLVSYYILFRFLESNNWLLFFLKFAHKLIYFINQWNSLEEFSSFLNN